MKALRQLLVAHGLIQKSSSSALRSAASDGWTLRSAALDRVLSVEELATVLAHIAKRRGHAPWPTRRKDHGSGESVPAATETNTAGRTHGERIHGLRLLHKGDQPLDTSCERDAIVDEIRQIFTAQRRYSSAAATAELEEAYLILLSADQWGAKPPSLLPCPFEPGEYRTSIASPAFEAFRVVSMARWRLACEDSTKRTEAFDLARLHGELGSKAQISPTVLRAQTQGTCTTPLNPDARRLGKAEPCATLGTQVLRATLGENAWTSLSEDKPLIDAVADAVAAADSEKALHQKLASLGICDRDIMALSSGFASGIFRDYRRTARYSAKALRRLTEVMALGHSFDEATAALGYIEQGRAPDIAVTDRASLQNLIERTLTGIGDVRVRKVLTEGLKQLFAVRKRWGSATQVCISIDAAVGVARIGRLAARRRNDLRARKFEAERALAAATLGLDEVSDVTLMRYRLAKRQDWRCPMSGQYIDRGALTDEADFSIDLILPWSRFQDARPANLMLRSRAVGRSIATQTPLEWLERNGPPATVDRFKEAIASSECLGEATKRRFLFASGESDVAARRAMTQDRRALAVRFRRAAQLIGADSNPESVHAPEVIAYASPAVLGLPLIGGFDKLAARLARPDDARRQALIALGMAVAQCDETFPCGPITSSCLHSAAEQWDAVFVAQGEQRRARGEGHEATVRRLVQEATGPVIYERRPIEELDAGDLARIKDPVRNCAIIAAIGSWIAAGKPKDRWPQAPSGLTIRKVRIRRSGRVGVRVRGGVAERGSIVRLDLYRKMSAKGAPEFFSIPVYRHQIADKRGWPAPPQQTCVARKNEVAWPFIEPGHQFLFSVYHGSLLEIEKPDGSTLRGYFKDFNRSTGVLSLAPDHSHRARKDRHGNSLDGIGIRRVAEIRKFSIDRLGVTGRIMREPCLWHGRAVPGEG